MTNVAVLIILFTAARNPTVKNCIELRDALAKTATKQAMAKDEVVRWDEDMELIREFSAKTCKDGIKR